MWLILTVVTNSKVLTLSNDRQSSRRPCVLLSRLSTRLYDRSSVRSDTKPMNSWSGLFRRDGNLIYTHTQFAASSVVILHPIPTASCEPGHFRRYSNLLKAWRSGDQIPVGERDLPHPRRPVLEHTQPPAQCVPYHSRA